MGRYDTAVDCLYLAGTGVGAMDVVPTSTMEGGVQSEHVS